jgi:hypothetical protein
MNEPAIDNDSATLSMRPEQNLARQPITARLRTHRGEDERFEDWLGFVGALARLQPNRKEFP